MSEQFSNQCSATAGGKNDDYKTVTRHFSAYLKERGHSDGQRITIDQHLFILLVGLQRNRTDIGDHQQRCQ